jgi:hypothetical protein
MTIFEYLKTDQPWFDTSNYEWWQIAMFLTGAILWIVVYINTIYIIKKRNTVDIPIPAVILNFGCEVTTAFLFVPDMGKALVLAYWAWMVLDAYIVYSLLRYGWKQLLMPFFRNNFRQIAIMCLIISFAVQSTFILQYDLPMAPLDSFAINLVMSIAFIRVAFVPGFEGNSRINAWAKFLGTGIISLMFLTKYPDNYFLMTLYVSVAIFDIWYLYLLYKPLRLKNAKAN